jgi:osmotically-inducible protein OsmY
VRSKADKEALEQLVRGLDDVEAVINELELMPRKP